MCNCLKESSLRLKGPVQCCSCLLVENPTPIKNLPQTKTQKPNRFLQSILTPMNHEKLGVQREFRNPNILFHLAISTQEFPKSFTRSAFCSTRNNLCFCLKHRRKLRQTQPSPSCPQRQQEHPKCSLAASKHNSFCRDCKWLCDTKPRETFGTANADTCSTYTALADSKYPIHTQFL